MADQRPNDPDPQLSRRALVARAALYAAGLVALGGCASSSTTRNRVGEPLPADTGYRPLPTPRAGNPARARPTPAPGPMPGVMPRSAWARWGPDVRLAQPMSSIHRITVHHDGMSAFTATDERSAAERLERIRRAHRSQDWADIGYHYAIDPAGRVWACRPTALQGAHVKDHNEGNLGVMILGNYERQRPTPATLDALDRLIAGEMRALRIRVDRVHTHQEFAPTACPGRYIQAHMNATRSGRGALASV